MALYHSSKGSVGYEIVGSPTIIDGVASGFSTDDYLKLTGSFSTQNMEMVIEGTRGGSTSQRVYSATNSFMFYNSSQSLFQIRFTNENIFGSYMGVNDGERFRIELSIKNNVAEMVAKNLTRGTTGTTASYTFSVPVTVSDILLGRSAYANESWEGSIDLNGTYIKVNGQPWFGLCPVEVQKHRLKGPVGYTVVGSPTIEDGIASGFSSSSYLQIPQTYNATNNKNVEIYVRAKTPSTISSGFNPILISENLSYWGISSYTNLLFTIRMGYSDGKGIQFKDMYISGGIQPDTWYRFKITGNNGIWRAEIYSDSGTLLNSDDKDWTSNTVSANYTLYIRCTDYTGTYSGSIDLNQTYIKVNGKLWFYQPAPTKYVVKDGKLVFADSGLYLTGPNNYTVVGTPTIEDGIASGFSASNGLRINNGFNLQTPYEMVVSFSVNNISGGGNLCTFQATNNITYGLYLGNNGQLNFYSPVGAFLNSSAGAISTNQNYKAKYVMDGTNQSLYLDSGSGYVLQKTSTVTSNNHSINYFEFGIGTSFLYGSIDLNQTYIKVNDQLWFYGKNYATQNIAPVPAGYTFGNTTTPSIGYVDMRTQQFTAAPTGATIGRDE